MPNFSELKSNIINSHSLLDFFNFSLNIPVRSEGHCILAPHFIRSESHPSFAVYHDHAFDFTTHTHYNILDIYALATFGNNDFESILKAAEHFLGHPLNSTHSEQPSAYISQQQAFNNLIAQWHKNLIDNPSVELAEPFTSLIDYLHSRRISTKTIYDLKLGWCPENDQSIMRGRLIIPYYLHDTDNPVYANGRYMGCSLNSKDFPKYKKFWLNDPKYSLILKNCVWGLNSQRPGRIVKDTAVNPNTGETQTLETHHIKYDYLVIAEGCFDALAFYQEGYQVASSLGCGFSQDQKKELIQQCRHFADKGCKVFICLDNDSAGSQGTYNLALLLFKNRIPFVVGHLPKSIQATYEHHPHCGREVPIKDVSDYYSAGGDLERLIINAKAGVTVLAEHCRNDDELAALFQETAKLATTHDLLKLRNAAYNVMDDNGLVDYVDKVTGELRTVMDQKPRFNRSDVNFYFGQACKPLSDSDIAALTLKAHQLTYDTAGQFYEYMGGIWRAIHENIIERYISESVNQKINSGKMASVRKWLKSNLSVQGLQFNTKPIWCFRNGTLWLDEPDGIGNIIVDKDGHQSVRTQPANFKPSEPDDMSTIQMAYDYRYGVKNETLLRYISEWMGGAEDKQILLQQMAGYVLFAANTLQKFFYLIGDGANGKSTFLHILEKMFGKENCSSLQFHRFSSEFDTIALKNSRINICYDARTELGNAEDILKAVTSGDSIMAAHKGVDAEAFTTNAKIFVAANRYFSASDVSRGLLRRILFICFNQNFEGSNQKLNIEDEIQSDPAGMAGVFNWAYEGYKMLKRTGKFIETAEQLKLVEEFKAQLSPLMMFAREEMYTRFGCEIPEKDMYGVYSKWCIDNGEKRLSRTKFIYEIRQVLRTDGSAINAEGTDEQGLRVFIFPADTRAFQKTAQISLAQTSGTKGTADAYSGELPDNAGGVAGPREDSTALSQEERKVARLQKVLDEILKVSGVATVDMLPWYLLDTPDGRERARKVYADTLNMIRHGRVWNDAISPAKLDEVVEGGANAVRENNRWLYMYLAKNPDKIDEFITGIRKSSNPDTAAKTPSLVRSDLDTMMDDPDYVIDCGQFFTGCTNRQVWDFGWKLANALSKYGRNWQAVAEKTANAFSAFVAIRMFFRHEPKMKFLLPGFEEFIRDVLYTKFTIADDRDGTMTRIEDADTEAGSESDSQSQAKNDSGNGDATVSTEEEAY